MNSWKKSDSTITYENGEEIAKIGPNDLDLMKRLRKAGSDHRKYLRMINVSMDITAMQPWWFEFDTYKVGTVANSTSTMHKIQAVEQAEIGMLAQLQKPAKPKSRQFVLRDTDGHTHVLRERDVTFLESRHQYTVVHQHRDQYFVVRRPLTSVLEGMPDCFVRIHRSYAVNVTFVRQISRREVLLADGTSIPVPERRAKQVREDLLGVMSGLGAQGLMGSRT